MTSLVLGLIFVGLAGAWALVQGDVLALPDLSVVGPALLVVAGVAGLAATLSGSARSRRRAQQARLAQEEAQRPVPVAAPAGVPAGDRSTEDTAVVEEPPADPSR